MEALWRAALVVPSGEMLTINGVNGLSIAGAGGAPGQVTIAGGLEFLGTLTLDHAAIALNGGEIYLNQPFGPLSTATTLTLGSALDLEVHGGLIGLGGGTVDSRGLIDVTATGNLDRLFNNLDITLVESFINEGTLHAQNNTTVEIFAVNSLTNTASGLLQVDANATLSLKVQGSSPAFQNNGTITLGNASHLSVQETLDLNVAQPFASFGNIINSGGTIVLAGMLLNTGHVETLSSLTSQFGQVQVTGTIEGGTVVADDTGVVGNGLTLDGLTLDGTIGAPGNLIVTNGVTLHGLNGTGQGLINLTAPNAALTVSGGLLGNATVEIGNTSIQNRISLSGTLGAGITVVVNTPGALAGFITPQGVNLGVIDAAAPGATIEIGGPLTNQGTYIAENGGTLTFLTGPVTTGAYRLATGGTMNLVGSAPGTITFTDTSASTLALNPDNVTTSGTQAVLAGFAAGNRVDLIYSRSGIAPAPSAYSADFVSGAIDITLNGSAYVNISVAAGFDYTGDTFAFQSDGGTGVLLSLACFLAGTRIATLAGEVNVEALRPGDRVLLSDGRTRPVVWMGHRTVNVASHPRPDAVRPIRIRAGAFGPGRPRRDLMLSPEHAVYVDGVLVPAGLLTDDVSILPDRSIRRPEYWHVELDAHDVVLAEGLPVESYLDTGQRDNFTNAGPSLKLHPDFRPGRNAWMWETRGAAPLVLTGPRLEAVRGQLARKWARTDSQNTTKSHVNGGA
jgi:hypothetical protein